MRAADLDFWEKQLPPNAPAAHLCAAFGFLAGTPGNARSNSCSRQRVCCGVPNAPLAHKERQSQALRNAGCALRISRHETGVHLFQRSDADGAAGTGSVNEVRRLCCALRRPFEHGNAAGCFGLQGLARPPRQATRQLLRHGGGTWGCIVRVFGNVLPRHNHAPRVRQKRTRKPRFAELQ